MTHYGFRRYNCVPAAAATPCHCQHAAGPAKGYDDKAGYADGTCTRPAAGGVPGRGSALPPLRGTSSSLRAPIWGEQGIGMTGQPEEFCQ